jgi:hypothetical protein
VWGQLRLPVVVALIVLLEVCVSPTVQSGCGTREGEWVRVAEDCRCLLGVLPGANHWTFNANRSQGELWTINLTVSATGFHPITVLVCDGEAFDQWLANGPVAGCRS